MTPQCPICTSTAVMSKDAAKSMTRLIVAVDGFLNGIAGNLSGVASHQSFPASTHQNPLDQAFRQLIHGVAEATSQCANSTAFIEDVERYQFMYLDFLCLRCGTKFDVEPSSDDDLSS